MNCGEVASPGVVKTTSIAKIIMGPRPQQASDNMSDALLALFNAFKQANVPCELSDNIQKELWKKFIINNEVNPLSAITELDTYDLPHQPIYAKQVYAAMSETVEAARVDDVYISVTELDEMLELIKKFNAIKTSMLIDKEKGRPLEIDAIIGAVLKRFQKSGVAAPVYQYFWDRLQHLA